MVPEMDCPSCAKKVGKALSRVDGVVEHDLQPTSGSVRVRFHVDEVDEDDVREAVESAGYRVASVEAEAGSGVLSSAGEVWRSRRAKATYVGAVFLVVGLLLEFPFAAFDPGVYSVYWLELSLADVSLLAATVAAGLPIVRNGFYSYRNLNLDVDMLMASAIVAATAIGFYYEAAILAVLFSFAELLERYSMDQSRSSIRELVKLKPERATLLTEDGERDVSVDEIEVGDVVAVRPGEKVPVDGVVVVGESALDESPITGESLPVDKQPGDEVYAGSLNESGYIEVEAEADASGSTLNRIVEIVREAEAKTTEKEQFVDRFASVYTPTVVALAVATVFLPPLLLGWSWSTWFVRGLTLLVIACPCAFVISTPVTVASGITSAARNGVLVKGGDHLEAMGAVDAVALDKTGTLTQGELRVSDVIPVGDVSTRELLRVAASVERPSEHPISDAIQRHADDEGVEQVEPAGFESFAGRGVKASVDDTLYYVGKPTLFSDLGFQLTDTRAADGGVEEREEAASLVRETVMELERMGKTVVVVGSGERLLGVVAVADDLRPGARLAVDNLHRLGVEHVVMLTGDNEGSAAAVADEVGVDAYEAELLPEEKVDAVEELKERYGDVAMVGDGVNDAPALAAATVGVAMGAAGTDTAIETADIALMGDDVTKLPYLYGLSGTANTVVRQNIWSSLAVKLALAVGVPFGYVTVAVAVIVGDMGMSLGVTGNAMRLSRLKPERYLK